MHRILFWMSCLLIPAVLPAAVYYISPHGSDSNTGATPAEAWQSLEAANAHEFQAGDSLLLEGGVIFTGGLFLDTDDSGTPTQPITITSFGSGRATILAAVSDGIFIYNTSGIRINRLILSGSAPAAFSGINIYTDVADRKLDFIHVEAVEVYGFGKYGISIGSAHQAGGFRDVQILRSEFHDNLLAGLQSYGAFDWQKKGYCHENFLVRDCRAYRNTGIAGLPSHSGSGIVLSDVSGGVIEYCEAFENGGECDSPGGGPVGIWVWDCHNIVIQYNESHHNRSKTIDGGGFDLDGGVTHSFMQYNYSHDNDGAGYLLAQFGGARPMHHNVMRYNISQNDGRRNGYPGIYLWAAAEYANGGIDHTDIYNNTVFISPAQRSGHGDLQNPAFAMRNDSIFNTRLFNNLLITTGEAAQIDILEIHREQLTTAGNWYWDSGDGFRISWGTTAFTSFKKWRKINAPRSGYYGDPELEAAGRGGTLGNSRNLTDVQAYRLRPTSRLPGRGIDLVTGFYEPAKHDLYGPLPAGKKGIGVDE